MIEKLKGKTLLVGKDPAVDQLRISLAGQPQSTVVCRHGSVPNSVTRCRPGEGRAHAEISIDDDGMIRLTNLNPRNVTYVNDVEIESKIISISDSITLGRDRFPIDLPLVVETACDMINTNSPKTYDITHLKDVWENMQENKKQIHNRQKRINIIRSGCGLFTMGAMPCIYFFGPLGYLLTGIGFAGSLYSFIGLKNDDTPEVMERLTEDFQDHYVCPSCNKFLGMISYKLLKRQYSMHCPHCKCQFTEENNG